MKKEVMNSTGHSKYLPILKNNVEKGKRGENKGIPIPGGILSKYIPGIQRKMFTVLSESGVGKTKFTNFLFVYNTFFQYKKGNINDFEIWYHTGEMTVEEILGEFVCFLYYGITGKVADINELYSLGDYKIRPDLEKFINREDIQKDIRTFEEKVFIISERLSSGFIYKNYKKALERNGTVYYKNIKDESGKNIQVFNDFQRYDENKEIIFIVDNATKLSRSGKEFSKKEAVDNTSFYLDKARYQAGFITVFLQQVNRNVSKMEQFKLNDYFPSGKQAKESESPYHDSQVVLSQIDPYSLGLKEFGEIPVKSFKHRLRIIKIIKNRGLIADMIIPYLFIGENAYYEELRLDKIQETLEKHKNNIK